MSSHAAVGPERTRPPRSARWRWLRRVGLAAATALIALTAWLCVRGGRTVERPLVALLPEGTAVALQVHRLGELLDAYDASRLSELIAADIEVGALLLSEEEFRGWRDAHSEAEIRTHLDLGREFILGWFGEEVTVAFIPAPGEPHPGLVVMTQAELGFRERLAELLAQLHPGARLQTTDHRGTPITTWVGERPRDSISFCRFGETVALSLRTDSTAHLEAIVDAVRAEVPPEQPAFPPAEVPGFHAWANAERLPAFLASLPSDDVATWLASPKGEEMTRLLSNLEEARFTYALDEPRELRLALRAFPDSLPVISPDPAWQRLARREALAVMHLEEPAQWWRRFAWLVFDFSIEVDPEWSPERRERHLAKREWRVRLGHWLRDQLLPLLDGTATLILDDIVPRIGHPGIRAALVWETSQPEAVWEEMTWATADPTATLFADIGPEHLPDWLPAPTARREVRGLEQRVWLTPLGELGWTMWENCLLVTLDDVGARFSAAMIGGWPDSFVNHPAHRGVESLWGDAPRLAEIRLHAYPLTVLSPLLLALSPEVWTESGRRHLEQIRLANHLLARYPAAGLALQQREDGLELVLAVTASGEIGAE